VAIKKLPGHGSPEKLDRDEGALLVSKSPAAIMTCVVMLAVESDDSEATAMFACGKTELKEISAPRAGLSDSVATFLSGVLHKKLVSLQSGKPSSYHCVKRIDCHDCPI